MTTFSLVRCHKHRYSNQQQKVVKQHTQVINGNDVQCNKLTYHVSLCISILRYTSIWLRLEPMEKLSVHVSSTECMAQHLI